MQFLNFVIIGASLSEPHCYVANPLTYTYLDCLLAVKMRGHKMAEI